MGGVLLAGPARAQHGLAHVHIRAGAQVQAAVPPPGRGAHAPAAGEPQVPGALPPSHRRPGRQPPQDAGTHTGVPIHTRAHSPIHRTVTNTRGHWRAHRTFAYKKTLACTLYFHIHEDTRAHTVLSHTRVHLRAYKLNLNLFIRSGVTVGKKIKKYNK